MYRSNVTLSLLYRSLLLYHSNVTLSLLYRSLLLYHSNVTLSLLYRSVYCTILIIVTFSLLYHSNVLFIVTFSLLYRSHYCNVLFVTPSSLAVHVLKFYTLKINQPENLTTEIHRPLISSGNRAHFPRVYYYCTQTHACYRMRTITTHNITYFTGCIKLLSVTFHSCSPVERSAQNSMCKCWIKTIINRFSTVCRDKLKITIYRLLDYNLVSTAIKR